MKTTSEEIIKLLAAWIFIYALNATLGITPKDINFWMLTIGFSIVAFW